MTRPIRRFFPLVLAMACSTSSPSRSPGTGGVPSTGGMGATGGAASTGGVTSTGGASSTGGVTSTGGARNTAGAMGTGGVTGVGGVTSTGGVAATGGASASGGVTGVGGATRTGGVTGSGGIAATGGVMGSGASILTGGATVTGGVASGGAAGTGGSISASGAAYPFPQNFKGTYCTYPATYDNAKVTAAYQAWKTATITSDGAGNFQRVKKPDSGTVIGSTVSEGVGYGMVLAVYMDDQKLFDNLWSYEQIHLGTNGLMDWEIGPDGKVTSGGAGGATDGDEDMAWALVMADKQWGGKGSLSDTYLNIAKKLIGLIWTYEVDHTRGEMLKAGDQWGDVDVTNPSYFAPAYFRVFGQVTGKTDDWNKVITANYDILEKSLNATSGNASNGLVPAWCDSSGKPIAPYSGAPMYFQNDSTRTPFRVGQDYCYFGEPRAKSYLAKISAFYVGVGVSKIVDGYELNGTPKPDKAVNGLQPASFVGPAGVGAMAMAATDAKYQTFVNDAYAAVATLNLTAGTIYYQKSWTALSLLMLTANLVDFTHLTQ